MLTNTTTKDMIKIVTKNNNFLLLKFILEIISTAILHGILSA